MEQHHHVKQYSLDYAIWDAKHGQPKYEVLNDKQKEAFLSLIGKGCRQTTKDVLARRLNLPLSLWERFGIYSRVILTDEDVEYICGQSWPEEMQTLRKCVINN